MPAWHLLLRNTFNWPFRGCPVVCWGPGTKFCWNLGKRQNFGLFPDEKLMPALARSIVTSVIASLQRWIFARTNLFLGLSMFYSVLRQWCDQVQRIFKIVRNVLGVKWRICYVFVTFSAASNINCALQFIIPTVIIHRSLLLSYWSKMTSKIHQLSQFVDDQVNWCHRRIIITSKMPGGTELRREKRNIFAGILFLFVFWFSSRQRRENK